MTLRPIGYVAQERGGGQNVRRLKKRNSRKTPSKTPANRTSPALGNRRFRSNGFGGCRNSSDSCSRRLSRLPNAPFIQRRASAASTPLAPGSTVGSVETRRGHERRICDGDKNRIV